MISLGRKESQFIKCECCDRETMAEIHRDRIVITDRRHGKKHIAIITVDDILAHMDLGGYVKE